MAAFARKLFVLVLLLIILLTSDETVKNTEAVGQEEMKNTKAVQIGDCTDHKLIGFCIKTRICNRKCINQGYEGGKCSAFLCVCYRPCPT